MDYWIWILPAALVLWFVWFNQRGKVSLEQAKAFLESGALVLDVRTRKEFAEKHLPGTINLPLQEVVEKIEGLEPDKSRVILCHCVSGGRSGIAMKRLQRLGYRQAHNLGSYGQAAAALHK